MSALPAATAPADFVQDVFVALSDPTRFQVLRLLSTRSEASATTLASQMPVSRPAVIKHLDVLARARLVDSRRSGREVLYTLRPERLESTASWMVRLANDWDARLTRLKALAEAPG